VTGVTSNNLAAVNVAVANQTAGTTAQIQALANTAVTFSAVSIGTQTWSASNMSIVPSLGTYWTAYSGSGGSATDNDGYFYTWDAAQTVCPVGWKLPSDAEWKTLEGYLGMMTDAQQDATGYRGSTEGTKLKSDRSIGFNAKLTGFYNARLFEVTPVTPALMRGTTASYWSSTSSFDSGNHGYVRTLHTSETGVGRYAHTKDLGYSVRCLKVEIREVLDPMISIKGLK